MGFASATQIRFVSGRTARSHAVHAHKTILRRQRRASFIQGVALEISRCHDAVVGEEERAEGREAEAGGVVPLGFEVHAAELKAAAEDCIVFNAAHFIADEVTVCVNGNQEQLGPVAVRVANRANAAAGLQPHDGFKDKT